MTEATRTAERDVAPTLLRQARDRDFRPKTLGGDKNDDVCQCVADIRAHGVTPHVTQNTSGRRSTIDGRSRDAQKHRPAQPRVFPGACASMISLPAIVRVASSCGQWIRPHSASR